MTAPTTTDDRLTKQLALLAELVTVYDRGDFNARCRARLDAGDLDLAAATKAVRYLIASKRRLPQPPIDFPDGLYALGTKANHRRFKVTKGRKVGVVFVDEVDGRGVKTSLGPAEARKIAAQIARAGWQAAAALYGQVSRTCSKAGCGRPLHDPPSVMTGYGPDCRETVGVATPGKAQVEAWLTANPGERR